MPMQFEVGKTYSCRSACDHSTVFSYQVIGRTAKMLTLRDAHGIEKRRGVKPSHCGAYETCLPEGRYSMCPVISADRPAA